jgi:predicted ATP-grasp superfamily ATP-dependent carboligase
MQCRKVACSQSLTAIRMNAMGSPHLLLVSTLFKMPYRVLRCVQATGAIVYVLGTRRAQGLKYSRYCKEFVQADRPIDGSFDAELAEEINRNVGRLSIDMVLAGDAPSTRSLIAIRDLIQAPCFPMPELTQFDLLNDKWRFGILCRSLGIEYPGSRIFSNIDELDREIASKELSLPRLAKPLSMDGGVGIITLQPETARKELSRIFYRPILVQEFIEGEDIGASVFCQRGEIKAFIAHRYYRSTYTTFFDDAIYHDVNQLMRHLKVDGVFNFDMRLAPDGRIFYLECNPRFFFKIAMSMIAGINFVSLGLRGHGSDVPPKLARSVVVRFPKAMLATLHTPWKLKGKSREVLKFLLSDPIPYLREECGLENETLAAHRSDRLSSLEDHRNAPYCNYFRHKRFWGSIHR